MTAGWGIVHAYIPVNINIESDWLFRKIYREVQLAIILTIKYYST